MKFLSDIGTVKTGPLKSLSVPQLVIMVALASALAWILQWQFTTPFKWLWLRCVTSAVVAQLAFVWSGNLTIKSLPRTAVRFIALLITVPIAVFSVYMLELGGDFAAFFDSESRLRGWRNLSFYALIMAGTAGLVYLLLESAAEKKRQALQFELEKKTLEAQALAAQMRAMQAQVEPHFLFNTLGNVQQLVEQQSPRAAPLLGNLIGYLRAAVPQMRTDMTSLQNELDMAKNYLAIMEMRMPDRLKWRVELPPALNDVAIPPLTVMTLVENAVRHGIDPAENGGEVAIGVTSNDETVTVEVTDTGVGYAPLTANGFGLTHLREHLRAAWGDKARVTLDTHAPHGTRATLTFPYKPQ